jgi:periplasmic protein TonB
MLAYAANRPVVGKAQSSPNALLIVISVHVALIALVMSAKMDLPARVLRHPPTVVDFIRDPPSPPPIPAPRPMPTPQAPNNIIDRTQPTVKLPTAENTTIDPGPTTLNPGPVAGAGTTIVTEIPHQVTTPIHHDPQLLTPSSLLKPPYPPSKLLSEEEATLNLRLTIDSTGRVIAVDPVGRADREFLEAARRHLMARWRYSPATDDGRAVGSSMTITLRFKLEG